MPGHAEAGLRAAEAVVADAIALTVAEDHGALRTVATVAVVKADRDG